MKSEGKLRRNFLKGILGDALNALLCAVGHNLRMILRKILSFFMFWIVTAMRVTLLVNHFFRADYLRERAPPSSAAQKQHMSSKGALLKKEGIDKIYHARPH